MRAYVVLGGKSARAFDWDKAGVYGPVIACHEHALALPFAPQFQLAADWVYWRNVRQAPRPGSLGVLVSYGAPPAWRPPEGVMTVPCVPGGHWAHDFSDSFAYGLMVGGSSGVPAMNFAYLLGATELHLVGLDLDGWEVRTGTEQAANGPKWQRWRASHAYACAELEARGVELVYHGTWRPPHAG